LVTQGGFTVSHDDGKLVRLESGAWAQYRRVPVLNATASLLVAVELTEQELRELLPRLGETRGDSAVH
jgi:hypothetical protein